MSIGGLGENEAMSRQALIQFVRFLLSGGVAAALNYGSRFLFSMIMPFGFAVICAYFVGAITGFLLFRYLVFPFSGKRIRDQVVAFVAVSASGGVLTWIISVGLARYALPALHYPGPVEATAHAVGIAVPTITSFFGHKLLSFR